MSLIRILALTLTASALAACAGSDRDAMSSEDELRGGRRRDLGEECTTRSKCKDGLRCEMLPPPPCGAVVGACPPPKSVCVESEDALVNDPGEVEQNGGVTKHYYDPIAPSLEWKRGCGMRPLPGQTCPRGLFVAFMRKYEDLITTRSATVDADAKTITVKLTTWSTKSEHPRKETAPEQLELDPEGIQMSTDYDAKIVDRNGNEIWSGPIRTELAM